MRKLLNLDTISYLVRYVYKRITHRFKKIGFPVGFECNVSVYNARFISMGNNVFLGKNVIIQVPEEFEGIESNPQLIIGNRVTVGMGGWINAIKKIHIKNNVLIGPHVFIADHLHKFSDPSVPIRDQGVDKIAPVTIEENAWIGAGVVINPGVTIGKNSVVGANSVVTKDIPDYTVAVGSPARPISTYNFKKKSWEKI